MKKKCKSKSNKLENKWKEQTISVIRPKKK